VPCLLGVIVGVVLAALPLMALAMGVTLGALGA
jgi:hypothetical protein